ncbi:MAG: hypothetical protein K2K73_03550, partial [Ureaplasma sp.]|nr:hypothetical protein [Ureaplasma sp.]
MKFKKSKLLISLLSVGALSVILVPTITLTSCSSTANPYLEIFKSTNSNLTYNQTGNTSSQADVVDFEMNSKTKIAKVSIGSSTPKTEFNSNNSFVDGWTKIKNDNTSLNLPDSITGLKTTINDTNVLNLIKNQNILNIFMDTINNLSDVYENFYSVFITKNSN